MPKRWSRGYTPALIEELDMPISGNALQLLLRIRRDSDMREADGFLTRRQVDALAVGHGTSKGVKRKALGELISVGLVHEIDRGFTDLHFDQWCRTHAQRKDLREKWNAAKREPKSGSTVESPVESTQDSARTASASPSASSSTSAAAATEPAAADSEEVVMPTQDAMATIARAWQDVTGKDPTHSDVGFFAHWLDQYQLSDSQVLQEMRRVTARQGDKGEPVKTAKYLDQVMRELSERKPPRGPGIVHEIGEPLHLVAPRGVDAHGNPEPPEPLEIPA
jgi:hypothetical protein